MSENLLSLLLPSHFGEKIDVMCDVKRVWEGVSYGDVESGELLRPCGHGRNGQVAKVVIGGDRVAY
jgi:hypothetical protein